MRRITVLLGTRPEAIKVAPVVRALRTSGAEVRVLASGQHRELVDDLLPQLGLVADRDLRVMSQGQSLTSLTGRVVDAVGRDLAEHTSDALVVQGDTTTAFAGGTAGYLCGVPVAHVEAGLRTGRPGDPFPEEGHRQMLARIARWSFAPTVGARNALLDEGVAAESIEVTGNTVIDNLHWVVRHGLGRSAFAHSPNGETRRRLLVTLHRRENHGPVMTGLARAVGRLATLHDLDVVLPLHPNPDVRACVLPELAGHPRVTLAAPLPYLDFVATMADCDLVMTDSGGVQEEAPSLGKPVLVLRETTERPEAVDSGSAVLTGTDPLRVEAAASTVLTDGERYQRMSEAGAPFGDGRAAPRIAERMLRDLTAPATGDERVA